MGFNFVLQPVSIAYWCMCVNLTLANPSARVRCHSSPQVRTPMRAGFSKGHAVRGMIGSKCGFAHVAGPRNDT